jgi:hypothetical protein
MLYATLMMNQDSSARQGSPWKGWVLAAVAVPVVYVLGIPPLLYCLGPSLPGKRSDSFIPCPDWVMEAADPWKRLGRQELLHKMMDDYERWWIDRGRW